ncbi:hypothetical protein B0J13DRAFT_35263 [Dactylonectria estremocensis]|uniref:Protein kinase domain-containing protein n=1 Tax=Dactylonectria estremocensis TaxID=1079267 RepID=A0A9P9FIL8_9HYPO|nr:hypothetical protein B0J13DRAFT_35263 [Dactylonectria estremocensis]
MAETLGIVTGILGLLPLCREGFVMIKDMVEAKGKMAELLTRIEAHHGHFVSWYEVWGNEQGREAKFRAYEEERPVSAKEILRHLALFSRLFYDFKSLEKYGFRVTSILNTSVQDVEKFRFESDEDLGAHNIESFRASCSENLSLAKKLKFVLWSRDKKLEDLISRLREYNEVLWRYGPGVEVTRLDKGVYDKIGTLMADQLQEFFSVYAKEAETTTDVASARRYYAMAKMANFRSQLLQLENSLTAKPQYFVDGDFHIEENYKVGIYGMSTLGLLSNFPRPGDRRVVLIEWMQNPQLPNKKRDTEKLALLLGIPKPEEMVIPGCYGIVDDVTQSGRLGVVMMPPRNIRGNIPATLQPGAISYRRMPVTLRRLIENTSEYCPEGVSLGVRFKIAKQIIDTIHLIHAAEWAHKNVRSESILFFPEGDIQDDIVSSTSPASRRFGLSKPLLVGFNNARSIYRHQDATGEYGYSYANDLQAQVAATNMTFDNYQHPAKLVNPMIRYSRMYDLYSLGCVLLEIGLWDTVDKRVYHQEPYVAQKTLRGFASESTLDPFIGSIYGSIVRDCLDLGVSAELQDPARFGTDIASRLSQCVV